jgi:hypothetical protein
MKRLPYARGIVHRSKNLFTKGFFFDRPLLLIQSDDWGRVGTRDQDGLEELKEAGLVPGENPYDFYSLETSDDVAMLAAMLQAHRDSVSRSPVLAMYFVVSNVDFENAAASGYQQIPMRSLSQGLPGRWRRPGLLQAYRAAVAQGTVYPALHGTTHFCRFPVERELKSEGPRGELLRALWKSETPYIFWRMPWIGYEYWDPGRRPEERHLSADLQLAGIREAVRGFQEIFDTAPLSACAPGYRADGNTHKAWRHCGVNVAQSGSDGIVAPRFDDQGILNIYRNIDFEPALDKSFSVQRSLRIAAESFARGIPAVLSIHSINFHSSLKNYRSSTLSFLHEFLTEIEKKFPNLLYVHDTDLYELVTRGEYQASSGGVKLRVRQRNIHLARMAAQ